MRIEVEDQDIERIARRAAALVVEALEPLLKQAKAPEDPLLTVEELADYLKVSVPWVYKRTALKEIPHLKLGRLVMFRRSEIDAWLAREGRQPQIQDLRARLKVAT